jgi:hypothetical protein
VAFRTLTAALVLAVPIALVAQAPKTYAPESFRANGQILGAAGGAASAMTIAIDKYTADADHQKLADTLKTGGYAAFVAELKKAPAIGKLTIGSRTFTIRWARTVTTGGDHRRVAAVTDTPVFARSLHYFTTSTSFSLTSPAEYCSSTIWFCFLSNRICVAPNMRPSPFPSLGMRISMSVKG